VCESSTVDVLNDMEPTTLIYPPPTPNGETYGVKQNKNQVGKSKGVRGIERERERKREILTDNKVWWYWSEMTPDNVLLLKCYDSASRELSKITRSGADVAQDELRDVAGLTPHTAFLDSEGAKKGIQRKSIEVRALVFYD